MVKPESIVGIVNPKSAGGATGGRLNRLSGLFEFHFRKDASLINWKLTVRPGHAVLLTRSALEKGAEIILSVGGDGTHNEVVKGFFADNGEPVNPEAKLAIIPQGTGGDLRKSLGIASSAEAGIEVLLKEKIKTVDVGFLEYVDHNGMPAASHFINIASMGITGLVTHLVNNGPKWLGGRAVFALGTAKAFLTYKNRPLLISLDDGPVEENKLCSLVAANGQYFGGGMKVAPHALMDNGVFEVISIGDYNFIDFLLKIRHVYRGTHLNLEGISHQRAKKIRVGCESDIMLDVDGENPGRLPVTINILPQVLKVFAGENGAFSTQ